MSGAPACVPATGEAAVFDAFPWWDERGVLTYITPTRFRYISAVAGAVAGQRILDLGCGGGLLAEPLARDGAVVTGIDISANALHVGRQHAQQSGLSIEYLLSPAEDLPFGEGSFDAVIAFDVFEHVCDLAAAYVLSPNAALFFVIAALLELTYCKLARVTPLKTLVSGAMVAVGDLAGWVAMTSEIRSWEMATLFI
ncbi:MAG: methyltransferase domain-containing protein [Bacteroidetes bacterium]|nr:methyltransferase domain-containing protein [Bacteroidota bacterium]